MCQSLNSLHLNLLDFKFFSAIQALQHKETPKTIDDLIVAMKKSYEIYSSVKSNRIFLTLQTYMVEIMKSRGSEKYKIPHLKEDFMKNK